MPYSKELIQKTIDMWQPYSKEKLTEEDAREILDNTTDLVLLLAELDKKYGKEKDFSENKRKEMGLKLG